MAAAVILKIRKIAISSQWNDRFWRDAVLHGPSALADILVNSGGPIYISRMAEARAVKFNRPT